MTFTPPLWSLTQTQVLDYALLTSMQGHAIRPKDDPNNALYVWRGDVDRALTLRLPVSDEVIASRQRSAHPITAPKILVNAKGRPFTWSFSALQDFEGCPARYAHKRFYCDVTEEETESQRWGNRVHKAGELHVQGAPHNDPEAFAPVARYAEFFRAQGAQAEVEICLTEDLRTTTWFASNVWYRGKLDIWLVQPQQATYADYKTGKPKDDTAQLDVCIPMTSLVYPEIEVFNGRYIWLQNQTISGKVIRKEEIPSLLETILSRVDRMKKAWAAENFPAKPSGLCRWKTGQCPAYSICQYRKG